MQATALDRWPDGSLRWMLVDLQADIVPGGFVSLHVTETPRERSRAPLVETTGPGFRIDTGPAVFLVGPERFPFQDVKIGDRSVLDPQSSGLVVTDSRNEPLTIRVTGVAIETNGPVRAVLRVEATVGDVTNPVLRMVARLHFLAGQAIVKLDVTLRNPRPARHKGGYWELGDPGSIHVRNAYVRFGLAAGHQTESVRCSAETDGPFESLETPFRLSQHSSGGENWCSPVHRNRSHALPLFRGYRVVAPGVERTGLRATPIVQLQRDGASVAVAVEHFWENFPKSIEARDGVLSLHLFPQEPADLHEVQGGEQKTHSFWTAFGDGSGPGPSLEWCRNPSRLVPDPASSCGSGVVPFLTPANKDPNPGYSRLVNSAIDGDHTFIGKREVIDEYGWRHFGEVYADHEAVFHTGALPLVSHYNNQYDAIAGCAYQFLRSGNPAWWPLMDDLARHVVDIDIYHTDRDWPKYNHGLFWHTVHYKDAGISTHRTYPRTEGVYGGGPSAGHLYTTGLMLHYFLTGSSQSRDAVIELATFVIDADDGSKSIFRWLDRGRTGFATASGTEDYHGPGRASGNALNALLDAHQLTGDARFLEKAEEIIRRSIHPGDDIGALNLLDADWKWFYTVFLQALAKYLWRKHSIGQVDRMYAYAQTSLLAYAQWMAAHEYPFLTKPELLEYPTETWAAQDMRKSEVFKWAALHSDSDLRAQFLERAEYFFEYSITTLADMPTRTLARPVIVLLGHGWNHAAFATEVPRLPAGPAGLDFGTPERFVPQKRRALRRAMIIAGAMGLLALAGLVVLLRLYLW